MSRGNIVVGLDLGTTKTCVVVAELGAEGIEIIGYGHSPSDGLRRGNVVDAEKTVQAVKGAVHQAELMAGMEIEAVHVGISGEHIRGFDSRGSIAVGDGGLEITEEDRNRVVEAARTVAIPFDREVLHVIPQEFTIDNQTGIRDPVGMTGVRLESSVHIVTGAVTSVRNISRNLRRTEIEVNGIILEPLASSRAVLREEEKEVGVCVVDIGGSTTDLAIHSEGSVRRITVLGVGGQNATSDIAICLRTSWPLAEDLKCRYGMALPESADEDDAVELKGVSGRKPVEVAKRDLATIIEARMKEIFAMVRREIDNNGYVDRLGAGIVLTGGGALVEGSAELAERSIGIPVRLGVPAAFPGVGERLANPCYATVLGLALMAADEADSPGFRQYGEGANPGLFGAATGRMRNWIATFL